MAVGAGEPAGKIKISQAVATDPSGFGNWFHPNTAEVCVTLVDVNKFGFRQVGGGPQVTFASQPGLFMEKSLTNLNVKHPSTLEDVNGPGILVPQYAPGTVLKKPFPVPFVLEIWGAKIEFPSYTKIPSQLVSVSKAVNVTVTCSPTTVGQMITVEFVEPG